MGETWLAVQRGDAGFEQRLCLKFVHESFRGSPHAAELFMREAAIGASLRHSNIVGVIGVNPRDGYLALELVEGPDLRTLLRELPNQRLTPQLVVYIALELCKALHYAHTRESGGEFVGVVHRDISPANVLASYAGEVKLADFGIAKAIRATGDVNSTVRGKLSYMSPEHMMGRAMDARSDLFSLGVLLYEAVSGQRPFDGQHDGETVQRIIEGRRAPLAVVAPSAPAGLTIAIEKLLHVDPDQRFESAAALIDALSPFAPPPTACFELGALARKALPHQTLGTGPTAYNKESAAVARIRTERMEPAPERPGIAVTTESTPAFMRRRSFSRPTLFVSAALLSLVGAGAWLLNVGRGSETKVAVTRTTPATAAPSEALAPPAAPSERNRDAIAVRGVATAEPSPAASVSAPTSEDSAPARNPAAKHGTRKASLKIGVFPSGNIWINGKKRGAAPMLVQLSPGAYNVAAGVDEPAQTRSIELAAGANEQLVFDLQATARGTGR